MRQRHAIPNYVNAYLSRPNETFKKKESKDELQERVKEEKSRKKNEPR